MMSLTKFAIYKTVSRIILSLISQGSASKNVDLYTQEPKVYINREDVTHYIPDTAPHSGQAILRS